MAVECVFYSIKTDGVTSNGKALDIFQNKKRIRDYCTSQEKCPNEGRIENDGHFHSGAGGFVPLICYKSWLSGIATNAAQGVADRLD